MVPTVRKKKVSGIKAPARPIYKGPAPRSSNGGPRLLEMGLMSNVQATDPEAWVDRHGDGLYRYALLRLRSPDLAADAVQETFLEAFRARRSFSGRSSERTWLVGILRHKILDHFRRSAGERAAEGERTAEGPGPGPAFDRRGRWREHPASWGGDPARAMETQEFWDVFGRCLAQLPQGLADTFFLREVDGLRAEEVRDLLGISAANLWARLHRGRSLLRRCLELKWFGRTPGSPPLS
jgi:RNA polymerase sigma-70 factor (ECF subfamily)